ncbi:hypothetical protein COCON_G00208070 [Conger conger]|uniref:GP-PDE domain-containing protein n=1 Tax=Conger conger TaxID=82655 RepID=A0A9Q1HNK6_CONCO|nr:hypothetical protein COCON_G00208070 [Conger conger]
MLQIGDGLACFSAVFLLVLLGTRSAVCSSVFTAALYVFLLMFRYPQRWGHDAPENTLAAIQEASKNGATGVELDLEFTADGVPVLMHDETVDRTTNGSGPVGKLRFVELRKLDASVKHRLRDKFPGQKVPTLLEAVEECIKHQLTIFFDVKTVSVSYRDLATAALRVMYKKHPVLYNTSIVCSFEPKVIYKMRQADPEVVTALTHRPWSLSRLGDGTARFESPWKHHWLQALDVLLDWAHHHLLWNLCGVSAFLLQKSFISPDYVHYWSQRGVSVVGWTINTAVEKQYYQDLLKISYITDSLREDCDPHY